MRKKMRILIAYDGSEAAEAALLWRASAWGADVLVVGLARPAAQNLNAGGGRANLRARC